MLNLWKIETPDISGRLLIGQKNSLDVLLLDDIPPDYM